MSQFCCQLNEVGDFSCGYPADAVSYEGEQIEVEEALAVNLAVFATTNHVQEHCYPWLKRKGFKVVARWKSPETGSDIKLWFRGPIGGDE